LAGNQRNYFINISYQKPKKYFTTIKIVATLLSFILIVIFAPRMDAPRIINGIRFTIKQEPQA
jgi:hypothetical protein